MNGHRLLHLKSLILHAKFHGDIGVPRELLDTPFGKPRFTLNDVLKVFVHVQHRAPLAAVGSDALRVGAG